MAVNTQQITSNLLGVIGAVAGAVLGYYTFQWILDHGYYGMMIPGAFLGLGCGLLARHPSQVRGGFCALAALGLGVFTEWSFFPFVADNSLGFFLKSLTDVNSLHLVMIAAGAFFAYWLGKDSSFRLFPGKPRPAAVSKQEHSSPEI